MVAVWWRCGGSAPRHLLRSGKVWETEGGGKIVLRSFSRSTLRAQNNQEMSIGLTKGLVARAYTVPFFKPVDVRTHHETQEKKRQLWQSPITKEIIFDPEIIKHSANSSRSSGVF